MKLTTGDNRLHEVYEEYALPDTAVKLLPIPAVYQIVLF